MSDDKRKQRRYRRISQNLPVELRFCAATGNRSDNPPIRGVVTDIGAAGIHVLLGTAYYAGTHFEASMSLDGVPVVFNGTVRHVRWFCGTPGLTYGHGIQITGIEESTVYKILDYINRQISYTAVPLEAKVA